MSVWGIAAAGVLVASLAVQTPTGDAAAALARAEARWQAQGPKAYQFGINLTCFCGPLRGMGFRVLDGQVQTPPDADAATRRFHESYGTVEKLFAVIRGVLDKGGHKVVVKYDSDLGYPIWADLDPQREVIDDELFIRVSGFRISKAPEWAGLLDTPRSTLVLHPHARPE